MTDMYILNEYGEAVAEPDSTKWSKWYSSANNQRIVKQEEIGETHISTVFLGIDHGWNSPDPILWETMCFGGALDQKQDRCGGSREQAEAMHQRMVERVKST